MNDDEKQAILLAIEQINANLWKIITDLHDNEVHDFEKIKNELIQISGELVVEIAMRIEKTVK